MIVKSFLIIFLITVFAFFVLLLVLVNTNNNNISNNTDKDAGQDYLNLNKETAKVRLSLVASSSSYSLNDDIPVKVIVDTLDNKISGVDVVLKYNPQYLNFLKIDTLESAFSIFPTPSIYSNEGKIVFSALVSPQEDFQGKGEVVTILFRPIKEGKTEILFDFEKGPSLESNIALSGQGKDILEEINSLILTINQQ